MMLGNAAIKSGGNGFDEDDIGGAIAFVKADAWRQAVPRLFLHLHHLELR